MGKAPAFQFYAGDYLADERIALMTLEEEGAYNRARAYCWREGSIPADHVLLSRLLKNASQEILSVVERCFVPSPSDASRLIDRELEEQRANRRAWIKKSSEAGKKSGRVRRAKLLRAEPTFEPTLNQSSNLVEPNTNSSSSSSSSYGISDANASSPRLPAVVRSQPALAESIYSAYPRKEGRGAGIKAIARALERICKGEIGTSMEMREASGYLLQRTQEYVRSPVGSRSDRTLIPHPATWFNQSRYRDDDANWKFTGGGNGNAIHQGNQGGASARVERVDTRATDYFARRREAAAL